MPRANRCGLEQVEQPRIAHLIANLVDYRHRLTDPVGQHERVPPNEHDAGPRLEVGRLERRRREPLRGGVWPSCR